MVRLGSTSFRFSRFEIKAYLRTNREGSPRDIAAQGDSITHRRICVTKFDSNLGRRIAALGISLDTGLNMWTQERFQLDLACLSLKKIILFHGANDLSIGGNFKESSPQVDKTLELTRKMAVYALEKGVTPVLAETLPPATPRKDRLPSVMPPTRLTIKNSEHLLLNSRSKSSLGIGRFSIRKVRTA